jgi:mRNA-degrading endonuclease toxin of MazEF toxin-antitoxin module
VPKRIEARRDLGCGGRSGYAGKPRPVVIVQDDRFDATDSVTICGFTTDPTEAPLIRLLMAEALRMLTSFRFTSH